MPRRLRAAATALTLAVGTLSAVPAPVAAAPQADRTETPVSDPTIPATVAESYVSLHVPMGGRPHPAACDRIGYLRFRARSGPADSRDADAVMVSMPGFTGGASMLTQNGAQTVAKALAQGKNIEYWAIDRRANCLEDHTGLDAANAARDPRIAVDYYFHGGKANGRRFAGFPGNGDLAFLADVGLKRTLDDEKALLDQAGLRPERTFCGGHSLGGPMTGMFAAWDFDGVSGASLCGGGYFAIDSFISTDPVALEQFPKIARLANEIGGGVVSTVNAGLESGILPRDLTVAGVSAPELFATFAILGVTARWNPDKETSVLKRLPHDLSQDLLMRAIGSRTYAQFLSGVPTLRDFRVTGEAALGLYWNRASMPLGLAQLGLGTVSGGPVGQKYFPIPAQLGDLPLLGPLLDDTLGFTHQYAPTNPLTLYRWKNYDEVDRPTQFDDAGHPYVTKDGLVTDIRTLAMNLSGGNVADLDEWNFPTRLLTDWAFALAGQRSGDLAHLKHPDAPKGAPLVSVVAEHSPIRVWEATGLVPADSPMALGYHHIDMAMAAEKQNNGRPELVSRTFADFVVRHS